MTILETINKEKKRRNITTYRLSKETEIQMTQLKNYLNGQNSLLSKNVDKLLIFFDIHAFTVNDIIKINKISGITNVNVLRIIDFFNTWTGLYNIDDMTAAEFAHIIKQHI